MAEVRLSPKARADLAEIDEYGAEIFGDEVAAAYALGFDESFALVGRHPQIGEVRPRLCRSVRCRTHLRHRIFYEVNGDVVLILRIFHHSRDVKRSLLK